MLIDLGIFDWKKSGGSAFKPCRPPKLWSLELLILIVFGLTRHVAGKEKFGFVKVLIDLIGERLVTDDA